MSDTILMEHTQRLLDDPLLDGESVDEKVRYLLQEKYLRRMAQYRRTASWLAKKYELNFEEFVTRRVVRSEEFSWQVETDAIDWETAISGIRTMGRKLKELHEADVLLHG